MIDILSQIDMDILVCGGAGFIGSSFIRNHLKNNPKDKIVNLDKLDNRIK